MKLPPLVLGNLTAKIPIVQGAMGIGISRSSLASAVASCGGIGTLAGVQIGYDEPDFENNWFEANMRALKKQIEKARQNSNGGIIGINFMVAMNNYDEFVKKAAELGIDMVVSGAGIPMHLPELVKGTQTKIVPSIASGKAAAVICKLWDRRYKRIPDMVIVEGPEAGGHLGFSMQELKEGNMPKLEDIIVDVLKAVKPYEKKYNKKIPVVAAGGVFSGEDIAKFLKLGASGVQLATRFVATYECDADMKYKQTYVNAKKEDIQIVKSPVGMLGRAIKNKFIEEVRNRKGCGNTGKCYNCLKPCDPKTTPYCISRALIQAVKGNIDNALIFTGSNSYRINKIVSVKEVIDELVCEAEKVYN